MNLPNILSISMRLALCLHVCLDIRATFLEIVLSTFLKTTTEGDRYNDSKKVGIGRGEASENMKSFVCQHLA